MGNLWFHVTRTWKGQRLRVQPQRVRADDEHDSRDCEPCICVSPSIAQCLVAVGDWTDMGPMRVYRTTGVPRASEWVFDYKVTEEHRFYVAKEFHFVRAFDPEDLVAAIKSLGITDDMDDLGGLDSIPFLKYKLDIYQQVLRNN